MQTASTQRRIALEESWFELDRTVFRNCRSAARRFDLTWSGCPLTRISSGFAASPHSYDRAAYSGAEFSETGTKLQMMGLSSSVKAKSRSLISDLEILSSS